MLIMSNCLYASMLYCFCKGPGPVRLQRTVAFRKMQRCAIVTSFHRVEFIKSVPPLTGHLAVIEIKAKIII